ncbi:MAG TPA: DNA mismatch repair protein MutS [Polyangiaceae bacterium]|nr:DNA mismatch repair protein MutS [Polyangiaceae bacterium]
MAASPTPVMQQHAAAKRAYPDAIVFFRMGDFYEMFGEDAVVGARLLELTLTARNRGKPDEIPMAGVPHHAAHGYISRLLELGQQVAICEQMADPSKVKGIVPREVVRVITPGLVTDSDQLPATTNNFLCAIEVTPREVGVALYDLSTGELQAGSLPDVARVLGELSRAAPREVLLGAAPGAEEAHASALAAAGSLPRVAVREDAELTEAEEPAALREVAAEAAELPAEVRRAVARALRFAQACLPRGRIPVRRIARFEPASTLLIERVAQQHLELTESVSGNKQATLLGVIDATCSPAGARLLRRRLLAPLTEVARIRRRHDQVELFVVHARLREALRAALDELGDLERLSVRASLGEATPRDLGGLRDGLAAAARAVQVLSEVRDAELCEVLGLDQERAPLDTLPELAEELAAALVERPSPLAKQGEIFRPEFDKELRELDALRRSGTEHMVALEARLRESTGIATLRIRFTRVFGWYIEVSRGKSGNVPAEFRRKQTVASGERYTLPEVDELADKISHAEERHRERELLLLSELVAKTGRAAPRIAALSERLSEWDVAAALADVAHRHDYVRPKVDESDLLSLRDARHPVVERLSARGKFVPNDVELDLGGERLWLVTGPNMAGKSTLLRQVALCAILAQMGSFVPARAARLGVVDRVLSRVGASDNLSAGESTFMVEMRETAEILRSATRRSLVILDEIGRGTSTFDGLSIAWAVAEYLDEVVGCRALFATHYHELTSLAEQSQHVGSYSVSAREQNDDVVFLHRLVPGAANRSYGVAVAKLAGLPEPVLARARALLTSFERKDESAGERRGKGKQAPQLSLFGDRSAESRSQSEVVETLRALDLDRLTGLEALSLLQRLKSKL